MSKEWNLRNLQIEREDVLRDSLTTVSDQALAMICNYEDGVNPDWDIESVTGLLEDAVIDPTSNFDDANNDISTAAQLVFMSLTEDPADEWFSCGFAVSELDSYWYLSGLMPHLGWGKILDTARQQNLATGLLVTQEVMLDWMLHHATYATLIKLASYVDEDKVRHADKPVNRDVPNSFYKALFSAANPDTDILGLTSAVLNDADVLARRVPIWKPWLPIVQGLVGHFVTKMIGVAQTTPAFFNHDCYRFIGFGVKELTTTWRPILDATTVAAYQQMTEVLAGINSMDANVMGRYRGSSLLSKWTEQVAWVDLLDLAVGEPTYGPWFYYNFLPNDAEGIRGGTHDFGTEHKAYADSWLYFKMRDEWKEPPLDFILKAITLVNHTDKRKYAMLDRYIETIDMAPESIRYNDITAAIGNDATCLRSGFSADDPWLATRATIEALDHIGDGRFHRYSLYDARVLDPMFLAWTLQESFYKWIGKTEAAEGKPKGLADPPTDPVVIDPAKLTPGDPGD